MKLLSKVLATVFGIGYFPVAPGTLTSFGTILLYKYHLYKWNWPAYFLFLILLFFAGIFVSSVYSKSIRKKDPRPIVIDEALGQLLVLFRLRPDWGILIAAFVLFRLFDIVKPPPIRQIERFSGGWGIMLDDLLAGVYAGIIINLYLIIK